MITWASLVPGLAAAVCAAFGLWGWAFAAFAVNRVLDGLDGMVARHRDRQSDYGGYLDIMVDFAVYASIPIGVWLGATGAAIAGRAASTATAGSPIAIDALPLIVLLAAFYVNAASWMYLAAVIEKRRGLGKDQNDSLYANPESRHADKLTTVEMPTGVVEGTETVLFFALFLLLPGHYAILFWIMAAATAAGVVQRLIWAYRTLR
jgi:phosphatidylglycerophosphate synthase